MSSPPVVAVFDSGVGGLSILQEIDRRLPGLSLVYCSDNAFFPYGTKPEDQLTDRVGLVLEALGEACEPDLIVVACNTASTIALPHLRERFSCPVVGVVPAIKPAASLSKSRVIGLLATPATVTRRYTLQLIAQFAADCEMIPVGSTELVRLAEDKLRGLPVDVDACARILAPFLATPALDTLVLGCTHFPLLREEIARCLPPGVGLVDSGEAIARRVEALLGERNRLPTTGHPQSTHARQALFTGWQEDLTQLAPGLEAFGLGAPALLPLPRQGASE